MMLLELPCREEVRDENDALLNPRERLIRLGEVKGSSVRKGAISGWSPDSGFRKSGGTKR
jgi:hypothetical protein